MSSPEAQPNDGSPKKTAQSSGQIHDIALSDGARAQLHYSLLSELADLLEHAHEDIAQLRDSGLERYPLIADARPQFNWIADTVEALDALGWRDNIARIEAERTAAAAAARSSRT
jgi:hypothetical protein